MDAKTFDRLSKMLSTASPRRRMLGLLASLPLVGLLTTATGDLVTARGRKSHRHQAHHQHRHAKTDRRKAQRDRDTQAEACIPTGQACPTKKARGKKKKKLSCEQCCQGSFVTDARGKKVCGCQPNGGACTTDTAAACCSGFCNGTACQAAPCSAAIPCPPCQSCGANGLCAPLPDGTTCDDGNGCTQTDTCQGGVCVGANPVVCPSPSDQCHDAGSCDPATGSCSTPPKPDGTPCDDRDACTTDDTCQGGVCTPGVPVMCPGGQHCVGGSCNCDGTSCLGCCAVTGCVEVASQTNGQCGTGTAGATCTACSGTTPVCAGGSCQPCSLANLCPGGQVCCGGACVAGDCCDSSTCSGSTPICVSHTCTACSGGTPCPGGQVCCGGACFTGICCADADCAPSGNGCVSHQCQCGGGSACSGGTPTCCGSPGSCTNTQTDVTNCGTCGHSCSGSTPACWNGDCVCGDVCPMGCRFSTVQAAIDGLPAGSTIRICAGTYGAITVSKNLTLIGAGDGSNPATNTILDAAMSGRPMFVNSGVTVSLQGLRLTGGSVSNNNGGGIFNRGTLTMTNCTVTGNQVTLSNGTGGGIDNFTGATLTMTNCTISQNSCPNNGGGINMRSGILTLNQCTLSGNSAGTFGGAIECNNGGTTNLFGCVIGPNNSAIQGGGISVDNSSAVTLDATSVTGNSATVAAGGIDNSSGTVTLQNGSTVSGNTAPTNPNCKGTISGAGCAP